MKYAALVGVVFAVGCSGGMHQLASGPSSVGGPDGGRVGVLELKPGELTSGTGTEPGTPGGGGAAPGLTCQGGTPTLSVNVDPGGIVKWQALLMNGVTVWHPEIRRGDDGTGEIVYRQPHEGVFGQAGPLKPGRYTMTIAGYRPTCQPQMGNRSALVRFSINGPGDNLEPAPPVGPPSDDEDDDNRGPNGNNGHHHGGGNSGRGRGNQ